MLEGTRYIIAAFLYLEKENDDRESLVGPLLSFGKEKCSKKDDGVSSPARKRMAARLDDHCVGDIAPLENNYFFSFNFSPELSHDELS